MKKKALRKEFYMEIRRSLGRFLSIFFIVAIGVAFFSGIRASEPDMRLSGDRYFDEKNLMDIRVISTLGLSDADVKALEKVEGIEKVEAGYSTDVLCMKRDSQAVVHVMSILPSLNTITAEEGRLPKSEDECAVDADFLAGSGYKIGDEIHMISGNDDPVTDTLVTDTFTIVGTISSPCYISFSRGSTNIGTGSVSGFISVPKESFKLDVYTEVYAAVDGAKELTAFTDEYEECVSDVIHNIEAIKEERQKMRRQEIVDEAETELDEARDKLKDAKKEAEEELGDAKKELDDGWSQLQDGKAKLSASWAELENSRAALISGQAELKSGLQTLENNQVELNGRQAELYEQQKELQKQQELLQEKKKPLEEQQAQVDSQRELLNQQQTELDQAKASVAQLQAANEQLNASVGPLQASAEALQAELNTLQKELADLDPAIPEQAEKIEELQKKIDGKTAEAKGIQAQLTEGYTQIATNEAMIAQIQSQIDTGQPQITAGLAALEEAQTELDSYWAEVNTGQQMLDEGQAQLADGQKQIDEGQIQLDAAKAQLNASQAEIDSGWAKLYDGQNQLAVAEAEIAENEKKLTDAQKEYDKGKKEADDKIADAEAEIKDGEDEISKIENAKWYIYDRDNLNDYTGYGENADRMRAIGEVFPVLFFLVAALISLTTMTRMVEEQRTQIGTMKALGYNRFSIAGKYLGYAFLATVAGCVIGILFGEKVFPYIIIYAYGIMYQHMDTYVIPYNIQYALLAAMAAMACTLLATVFSCYKELREQAAELMRPPTPKQGKRVLLERVPLIWGRLNFTWKSTIRNLVRYKKRFFMTIFGIGGCMALLLVGFGLKDSIFDIGLLQYHELQLYDGNVILNEDAEKEEQEQAIHVLEQDSRVETTAANLLKQVKVGNGKTWKDVYLNVAEDTEAFSEFIVFRDRRTKEAYTLDDNGVILTEKMAKKLDVEAGDTIYVKDDVKGEIPYTVSAVCENYMQHFLYMTADAYEQGYGRAPKYNSVYYRVKDGEEDTIQSVGEAVIKEEGALSVSYASGIEARLDDMLGSLNIVIVVLVISAGMLAFVVLYNLNNINITERKRELATLKVLGFYPLEVAEYVYRENIILTVLGGFFGIVFGKLLHRFIIVTVEIESAMFGRNIDFSSFVYGFLITFGFSVLVNGVMYFKLKKIDMVESLKSVE